MGIRIKIRPLQAALVQPGASLAFGATALAGAGHPHFGMTIAGQFSSVCHVIVKAVRNFGNRVNCSDPFLKCILSQLVKSIRMFSELKVLSPQVYK